MKTIKFLIAIALCITFLNNYAFTAILTIETGGMKFHINDGKGIYEWNNEANENCKCLKGSAMNCWMETATILIGNMTHDTAKPDEIAFAGIIAPIDVTVDTGTGGIISLTSQASNFEVDDCYYIFEQELIPGIPIGTIVDIDGFTTGPNGEFQVIGIIRQ